MKGGLLVACALLFAFVHAGSCLPAGKGSGRPLPDDPFESNLRTEHKESKERRGVGAGSTNRQALTRSSMTPQLTDTCLHMLASHEYEADHVASFLHHQWCPPRHDKSNLHHGAVRRGRETLALLGKNHLSPSARHKLQSTDDILRGWDYDLRFKPIR